METEHGPEPYQLYDAMPQRQSGDDEDTASVARLPSEKEKCDILWDINKHVGRMVTSRFELAMLFPTPSP